MNDTPSSGHTGPADGLGRCRAAPSYEDLDPQVAELLDEMRRLHWPLLSTLTPEQARELWRVPPATAEATERLQIEDQQVPGGEGLIPARLYLPQGERLRLLLVFFHGGGFVLESIDSHDELCRDVALAAGCSVLSVGYRLAPEHPFPAAVNDAYAATCWAAMRAAGAALAVGGDSAGGNLAAVTCLLARDRQGPHIAAQWLAYPVTDWSSLATPSYRLFGQGYGFDREEAAWFRQYYMPRAADWRDPRASPLLADDLSGLPPALIQIAEFDVLRDEGRAYAERLAGAGCAVRLGCYPGMVHAFYGMAGAVSGAEVALQEAAAFLRGAAEGT